MSMIYPNVAIVGLGLIGGSFAALIQAKFPDIAVFAVDPDPMTSHWANQLGLRLTLCDAIENLPQTLDLVIVATPIHTIKTVVEAISAHIPKSVVITDVASLKQAVSHPTLARPDHVFIPGHPMAGRAETGLAYASAGLLEGAPYLVVPCTDSRFTQWMSFLTALGFRVMTLDAGTHDRLVAAASHFPYLMACVTTDNAYSFAGQTSQFSDLLGPGFKSTTRVAAADPQWGASVSLGNREVLLPLIESAIGTLTQIQTWLQTDDREALGVFLNHCYELRRDT